MMTASTMLRAIISQPERDDLRREFALAIRGEHPAWSRYIDFGLQTTAVPGVPYEYAGPSDELRAELMAPFLRHGVIYCEFYRGFAETIYLEPHVFMKHGDALLDLAPILKVVFVTRDKPNEWTYWRDLLPELIRCPALGRVRELGFRGEAALDFRAMRILFESPHLDGLLKISRFERNKWHFLPWTQDNVPDESAMWEAVLESPVFRRLLDWGLRTDEQMPTSSYGLVVSRMVTRRQLGDRCIQESWGLSARLTRYEPMSAESRALEDKYGYMPALHAGNWNATVLDVLRGKKPDFPAGARPTEAMYAVPPPDEHPDTGW